MKSTAPKIGIPSIFSWTLMKRHWSVFPLVGIISFAAIEATSFLIYSATTKPDVNFFKARGQLPRHERVDPYTYRPKLWTHKEKHEHNPERDTLLKEIGPYKY